MKFAVAASYKPFVIQDFSPPKNWVDGKNLIEWGKKQSNWTIEIKETCQMSLKRAWWLSAKMACLAARVLGVLGVLGVLYVLECLRALWNCLAYVFGVLHKRCACRVWRASKKAHLECLACFKKWLAWLASKDGVLDVFCVLKIDEIFSCFLVWPWATCELWTLLN